MDDHRDPLARRVMTRVSCPPASVIAGRLAEADAAHPRVDIDLAAPGGVRDADDADPAGGLDEAERAFLVALADGHSVVEIATSLGMPEEMLGVQMANVLAKLHRQHALPSARRCSGVGGRSRTVDG